MAAKLNQKVTVKSLSLEFNKIRAESLEKKLEDK